MSCTAVITTRDSNEGETSVCLYVFHNGGAFKVVLAKPLCSCVQYAISSKGIVTSTLFQRKAFNCSTVPWFWGSTYSNSLQYMFNRRSRYKRLFSWSIPLKMYFSLPFSLVTNCHKYCRKGDDKTQNPVPPCSWTTQPSSLPRQKPWGKRKKWTRTTRKLIF